jgi:high-affinity Fe2+/Pb2+ permease
VPDILDDVQELVQQNLNLFRAETQEKLRDAVAASKPLIAGLTLMGVAGLLVAFTLVYLLDWLFPALPLWACYGIVTLALGGLGFGLAAYGKQELSEINPVPEKSLEELKENLPWNGKAT